MNLCKSGLISARTKSLREKFSRNRSYSELSFKETNTTSSLVSTPTESCSGSLAGVTSQTTYSLKKSPAPSATEPFFTSDPYCSALDLSAPGFDEPRFPWQRDVAIQCDLINAPLVWPPPKQKPFKEQQSAKKKTSSSSTSSAASTLINAAAATLRMTGITDSTPGNSRFWKSSLLLPSLNVSSVSESNQTDSTEHLNLRRQKSSRWASASVVRRPVLKRAASFDSRGGYARLVQSTSSPNSPPEGEEDDSHYFDEPPKSALPILTTTHDQTHSFGCKGRLTTDQSHSASYLASGPAPSQGGFFWNSHSLNNAFRPTALLGASAAMTAAAPFSTTLMSTKTMSVDSNSTKRNNQNANTTNGTIPSGQSGSGGGGGGRRKLSSNEISLKELRRKQFMTSRKQPSSAPDSFDDDSPFSVSPISPYIKLLLIACDLPTYPQ